MKKTYSKEEIKKALCRYHNLDGSDCLCGKKGTQKIMQKLGTIQYDPLNVVSRNADLVLQARVNDYNESQLYELLYKDHKLVDGYDKEMCIYNAADFKQFGYIRFENKKMMHNILQWRRQLDVLELLDEVRDFVAQNGKTGTKDLSIGKSHGNSWGHKKLSSMALDYLFNTGVISVVERHGTQKYFDLSERVFGEAGRLVDSISNSKDLVCNPEIPLEEFLEWYVERRIKSVGIAWNKSGGTWQGHYLSNSENRTKILAALEEKGRIKKIAIEGIKEPFYTVKDFGKYLKADLPEGYARFIAPLDNIMWDRQLLETLFNFEYRWEVYTPAEKRKYGYYVLPVLYNGNFVARFEPEHVSKAKEFVIKNWWWEEGVQPDSKMLTAIKKEIERFANFLGVPVNSESISVF